MKKLMMFGIALISAIMLSTINVNAEEIDLNTFNGVGDAQGLGVNFMIVGHRIFELNVYPISTRDITLAQREYSIKHQNEAAPVYFLVGSGAGSRTLYKETGFFDVEQGMAPREQVDLTEAFASGKLNATVIDRDTLGEDEFVEANLKPNIEEGINELAKTAEQDGFLKITLDGENMVFEIADPSKTLISYKAKLLQEFVKEFNKVNGIKSVSFNDKTVPLEAGQMDEGKALELAKAVLQSMGIKVAENPTYLDIAGKSVIATVECEVEGTTYTATYTLSFVYDVVAVKDAALTKAAQTLNTQGQDHGFSSIVYDAGTKTATFTISDLSKTLAEFATTDIIQLFQENMKGAVKVEYADGTSDTLTDELLDTQIKGFAKKALQIMARDTKYNLASVANTETYAIITYSNGVSQPYNLKFVYDHAGARDTQLNSKVASLKEAALKVGFTDLTYEEHTLTFTIDKESASEHYLAEFANSGIVAAYQEIAKDATKVIFGAGDEKDLTGIEDETAIKQLAKEILQRMSTDNELKLSSVAGQSLTVTLEFTHESGEVETTEYTLAFKLSE